VKAALRNRLKLAGLIVLLAMPVAWLIARFFGGFVREALAVPFLYLTWIVRVYVRTVPRTLFWGALLLFGVALAVTNVVIALGRDGRHDPNADLERHPDYADTVQQLTSQIRFAGRSIYFRRSLAKRLGRLVLTSRDSEDSYRAGEIRRALRALDAPPTVHEFFHDGDDLVPSSRRARWLIWFRRRLWAQEHRYAPPDDLEAVIRFLEDRLEVS